MYSTRICVYMFMFKLLDTNARLSLKNLSFRPEGASVWSWETDAWIRGTGVCIGEMQAWIWRTRVWSWGNGDLDLGDRGLDFVGRFGVKSGERSSDLDRGLDSGDRDWVRGSARLGLMVLGLSLQISFFKLN